MTICKKLFQYYPHKKVACWYEFKYATEDAEGKRVVQLLRRADYEKPFLETEDGKDYTSDIIKPRKSIIHKVKKIGMAYERIIEPYYQMYAQDDFRRVWLGIMLKLVADDLIMETPIHIDQKIDNNLFIRTTGYVYAQSRL